MTVDHWMLLIEDLPVTEQATRDIISAVQRDARMDILTKYNNALTHNIELMMKLHGLHDRIDELTTLLRDARAAMRNQRLEHALALRGKLPARDQ